MWGFAPANHFRRNPKCYPQLSMIHINLQPELEAHLAVQAEARGVALDRYLEDLIIAQAGKPRTQSPAEAVAQIRELRKGLSLGGHSVKELINEGRKY